MELKEVVREQLEHARRRTLRLLEPFDDAQLTSQVSPLMSPLVWDLAHIGHYEELWLVRALTDLPGTDPRYDDLYDAFAHPRRERVDLPILGPEAAREFVAAVRTRTLDVLDGVTFDDGEPLLRDAFVYGMVIQHEHQHDETMLATIQLSEVPYTLATSGPAALERRGDSVVTMPGGSFVMGTSTQPWAYDNERPEHEAEVAPFMIDAWPVSNAEFAAFVSDGGYDDPRHWSEDGWKLRQDASLDHPQFWRAEGDGAWSVLRFGHRVDLVDDEPVQHVCWHEADAFARWAGRRLPTEAEWECAFRSGAMGGVGQVWEWTGTDFHGYPGFVSFPYREYSEVFFGNEYKVLRGASWAVDAINRRPTFRNWDFPIRRQIFAGFRCARDG